MIDCISDDCIRSGAWAGLRLPGSPRFSYWSNNSQKLAKNWSKSPLVFARFPWFSQQRRCNDLSDDCAINSDCMAPVLVKCWSTSRQSIPGQNLVRYESNSQIVVTRDLILTQVE